MALRLTGIRRFETNVEHSGNPDDRTDFTNIDWKNKFQFTSQKDAAFDTACA